MDSVYPYPLPLSPHAEKGERVNSSVYGEGIREG